MDVGALRVRGWGALDRVGEVVGHGRTVLVHRHEPVPLVVALGVDRAVDGDLRRRRRKGFVLWTENYREHAVQ